MATAQAVGSNLCPSALFFLCPSSDRAEGGQFFPLLWTILCFDPVRAASSSCSGTCFWTSSSCLAGDLYLIRDFLLDLGLRCWGGTSFSGRRGEDAKWGDLLLAACHLFWLVLHCHSGGQCFVRFYLIRDFLTWVDGTSCLSP